MYFIHVIVLFYVCCSHVSHSPTLSCMQLSDAFTNLFLHFSASFTDNDEKYWSQLSSKFFWFDILRFLFIAMPFEQKKLFKSCKSTLKDSRKRRYILCRAFILLQPWMVKLLNTFKRLSVSIRGTRFLQWCKCAWIYFCYKGLLDDDMLFYE